MMHRSIGAQVLLRCILLPFVLSAQESLAFPSAHESLALLTALMFLATLKLPMAILDMALSTVHHTRNARHPTVGSVLAAV